MADSVLEWGVSSTAQWLSRHRSKARKHLHQSSVIGVENVLFEELPEVWEECSTPNWDGYDALPVTEETYRNAERFLESLPLGFSPTSVGAEADGEITLEWYRSGRWILSVSVTPNGYLHYASIQGLSKIYGTEPFFATVPDSILVLIQRVLEHA